MKEEGTKTGYWIPLEIGELEDLNWTEKVLLSEIEGFTKKGFPCFKSNQNFANILKVEKKHVTRMITNLKNKGYITVELTYKPNSKEVDKRYITPNCGFYIHKNMPKPLSANMIPPLPLNEDTPLPLNEDTPLPLNAEDTKTNVTKTIITKTITISSEKKLKKEDDEKALERKRRERELKNWFLTNIWERYPEQHRVGENICFSKFKSALRKGETKEHILEGFDTYITKINILNISPAYIKRLDNWFASETWKNPDVCYTKKSANRDSKQKVVTPPEDIDPDTGDFTIKARLRDIAIYLGKCSRVEASKLSEEELKNKFSIEELKKIFDSRNLKKLGIDP